MALSKVDYNSLNVTAAASKALKWNSAADGFETGDVAGAMVLLETQTASSSGTLDFTSGIDDTYDSYVFKFYNIHPQTDDTYLSFNMSIDGGSNYNVTKTTTSFKAFQNEAGSSSGLYYDADRDLAQSTAYMYLSSDEMGNGADESLSGTMQLFSPSSTTFVKHFISRTQMYASFNGSFEWYSAGYGNTTSAVDAIQFKMSSGNIDSGVIKLYGIS